MIEKTYSSTTSLTQFSSCKPFVLSWSKHERLGESPFDKLVLSNRSPFDKLRANGQPKGSG